MLAELAFALMSSQVQFAGGDATDLTQAICKGNSLSAVLNVFDKTTYSKATFDPKDADSLSDAVRSSAKLVMVPGSDPIFHAGTLPRNLFQVQRLTGSRPWGFNYVSIPADAFKDGKLAFETNKGEALRVGDLSISGGTKRITSHWVFGEQQLVAKINGLSEADFLGYVAKAVGAKLLNSKDGYRLELDPREFRVRARKTIQEVLASKAAADFSTLERSDIELVQAALSAASDAQLAQAFLSQGASARIMIGPSFAALVNQRVQAIMQGEPEEVPPTAQSQQGQRGQRQSRGNRGLDQRTLSRIDTQAPAYFILNSDFRTQIEMSLIGPGNRTIRF